MYDKNKQIKKLEKITKFPKNWFISQNKEINSDILKSKCAITLSSASSFNCIRHGLPVLNLKSNFKAFGIVFLSFLIIAFLSISFVMSRMNVLPVNSI